MKNMRRVIAAFTAASFMASTMALSVHAESVMLGDANGDGSVDAYDMVAVLNAITALGVGNEVDAGFNEEDADVNENGAVDLNDVLQINNYYYYYMMGGAGEFYPEDSTQSSVSKTISIADTAITESDLVNNSYQVPISIVLDNGGSMEFGVKVDEACTVSAVSTAQTEGTYRSSLNEDTNLVWVAGYDAYSGGEIILTVTLPETAVAGDAYTIEFVGQDTRTAQAVEGTSSYTICTVEGNTATITVEEDSEPVAITPFDISVTEDNEYFECVDDRIYTKKTGDYYIVYDQGDYYSTYVSGTSLGSYELHEAATLEELFASALANDDNDPDYSAGWIVHNGYGYGNDNQILIYSSDGLTVDACYRLDCYDEPIYNLYMRYWRDDEANAAGGNVEAKYDIQLKIDTESYTVGPEYEENYQVNPPERAGIEWVTIVAEDKERFEDYNFTGWEEMESINDIVATFYTNGTYTFYASTSNGISLTYDFVVDTIAEETTAPETTTTETTTTTESTTTETTTTETTTTTESTTTEATTTESTTSESPTTETSTTETTPSETTEVSVGDLNNDTAVDASDAAVILVAAAVVGAGDDSDLTEEQKKAADVNDDSKFDAVDAALVLQYAAAAGAGYTGSMEDFLAEIKEENLEE